MRCRTIGVLSKFSTFPQISYLWTEGETLNYTSKSTFNIKPNHLNLTACASESFISYEGLAVLLRHPEFTRSTLFEFFIQTKEFHLNTTFFSRVYK